MNFKVKDKNTTWRKENDKKLPCKVAIIQEGQVVGWKEVGRKKKIPKIKELRGTPLEENESHPSKFILRDSLINKLVKYVGIRSPHHGKTAMVISTFGLSTGLVLEEFESKFKFTASYKNLEVIK